MSAIDWSAIASLGIERSFFKSFSISEMRLPGDIAARRKLPRVIALGESYAASGGQPAQPPVVEWRTNKLVIGRDRIAACLNLGLRTVDVMVVKGSLAALAALAALTHVENVYRRHDSAERDASLAELVRIVSEHGGDFPAVEEEEEEPENSSPEAKAHEPKIDPKPGRPAGASKKNAVEKVAKITGKTPRAIESAVHRVKKNHKKPAENRDGTECIDCHGMAVPKEVIADAYSEHVFLSHLDDQLIQMQADCTRHLIDYPTVKTALHAAAVSVRQWMPASVCLYCKVIPQVQAQCKACLGRGWLRAHEMHSLPGRMKATGKTASEVVFHGETLFVSDLPCS